jgi:hypothetical protein
MGLRRKRNHRTPAGCQARSRLVLVGAISPTQPCISLLFLRGVILKPVAIYPGVSHVQIAGRQLDGVCFQSDRMAQLLRDSTRQEFRTRLQSGRKSDMRDAALAAELRVSPAAEWQAGCPEPMIARPVMLEVELPALR